MEGEILPKDKGGRPSKYDPSFCDKIIELAYEGAGILEMMVACGISSKTTWYDYRDSHPEFKEASKAAKIISASVDEHAFSKIAREGKKGDAKALQWSLHNKAPEFYQMPNSKGPEITINGGNVILSTSEIDNQIEAVKAQLRSLNDIPDAEERLLNDK
tara:strand:- start:5810 stop:6286 length:477 start_codon:yes stop_codon:yes gene_type:complete